MLFRHLPDLSYVSYGGGVQSSVIALMVLLRDERLLEVCAAQNIPLPKLFVFANTGDEREETYEHIHDIEKRLKYGGLELHRFARPQSLSDHIIERAHSGERINNWEMTSDAARIFIEQGLMSKAYHKHPVFSDVVISSNPSGSPGDK